MSSNLAISLVVGASVGGAVAALKGLKSELNILKNSSLSTKEKFSALGTGVLKGLGGAVSTTSAISSSIVGLAQPAIAFESAMADVKKVVDFKSPEGFKNLSKDILELTRTIPMSAEELAAITASGGQLGVAEKDLKSFTATIAKMSVAFDMSAEDSGDSMAKLANVYKIPISEISKLGDAINELSNSSPAKASDIVNTLGRIGGVAKQFGLTENAAAALANSFGFSSKLGGIWQGVKQMVGLVLPSLFGTNENQTHSGLFSNYEPLSRNAVTHTENHHNQTHQQNNGGIVVHFNPTIQVNGNQSESGIVSDIQHGLKMSVTEFEQLLNRVLDQRQRRAY